MELRNVKCVRRINILFLDYIFVIFVEIRSKEEFRWVEFHNNEQLEFDESVKLFLFPTEWFIFKEIFLLKLQESVNLSTTQPSIVVIMGKVNIYISLL